MTKVSFCERIGYCPRTKWLIAKVGVNTILTIYWWWCKGHVTSCFSCCAYWLGSTWKTNIGSMNNNEASITATPRELSQPLTTRHSFQSQQQLANLLALVKATSSLGWPGIGMLRLLGKPNSKVPMDQLLFLTCIFSETTCQVWICKFNPSKQSGHVITHCRLAEHGPPIWGVGERWTSQKWAEKSLLECSQRAPTDFFWMIDLPHIILHPCQDHQESSFAGDRHCKWKSDKYGNYKHL